MGKIFCPRAAEGLFEWDGIFKTAFLAVGVLFDSTADLLILRAALYVVFSFNSEARCIFRCRRGLKGD